MKRTENACVLLFSGGRDSTIAAVRLSSLFERLILVTVTSEHLVGMDSVRQRLAELKSHLQETTQWLHVLQPTAMPSDQLFRAPTCLPCHRSYAAIGTIVAERFNADSLAFGYTRYQSAWPEQTPYAVERLTHVLAARRIRLELPVYDIASKSEAVAELAKYRFSTGALEQKCLRQQFNIMLEPSRLKAEIAIWEQTLIEALAASSKLRIEILAESALGSFSSQE
jgi:predicted subunit of tRNA(5-methylaminomethyl-2-thiouridylate) methyltransferase